MHVSMIKKIIKESLPEISGALDEIKFLKRELRDMKLSLERIEKSISVEYEDEVVPKSDESY